MTSNFQNRNIHASIADIVSNRLPLIAKKDISQIMMHTGYTQRQIDTAIKRMKVQGLVRIAFKNVKTVDCTLRQLPVDDLSVVFIQSIAEKGGDNGATVAKPTQIVYATARLSGLVGKNAIRDLEIDLLECYLRLGQAFAFMITKGTPGVDTFEALWPSRNCISRVAYARFKPNSSQLVNLAAAQPKNNREAKRWLESLQQSGGKYVLC